MSPADEWQLAQGTVEFRDEERQHRNRTDASHGFSSGLSAPVDGAGTLAPTGGVPSGQTSAGAVTPADSPDPGLCPNCLTDLDPDGYCDGCSYLATVKRPA